MRVRSSALAVIFSLAVLLVLAGCVVQDTSKMEQLPEITEAVAVLHPTEGDSARGTVRFIKQNAGIKIIADVRGLEPGKHGFHIHELGDCTAADATSAGGHFAPDGNPHGAPTDEERHAGDLGNLIADEEGNATLEMVDNRITFRGHYSIIGRAVIIHANEDDYVSQPTGNAGPRVTCGVIGIAGVAEEEE